MASQVSPFVSIHGRRFGLTPLGLEVDGRQITSGNPTYGNTFYVHSGTGDDSRDGKSPLRALATIDAAVNLCTANQGDAIIVLPGHTETITAADAIDLDVAGITLVGVGTGSAQPQVVFNHAAATIAIDADGVTVAGMRFTSSITVVGVGINIKAGATDAAVLGNRFDVEATTTDEFVISIQVNAGCDRARIEGNDIDNGLGGAAVGIKLTGASDRVVIRKNYITGDYSTACINGITTLSTNVLIEDNLLVQGIAGNIGTEPGIELLTGTTGIVRRNDIVCNLATMAASIVADAVFMFENYYNEDAAGTGALIGTASADDL